MSTTKPCSNRFERHFYVDGNGTAVLRLQVTTVPFGQRRSLTVFRCDNNLRDSTCECSAFYTLHLGSLGAVSPMFTRFANSFDVVRGLHALARPLAGPNFQNPHPAVLNPLLVLTSDRENEASYKRRRRCGWSQS
jgi:hypothetical protein